MVIQEVATQLENAAWLLKTGDRMEAYRILKALVRQDPVDWRAWWGLAHATSNPEERLTALRKTLQFNPKHAKAAELLRKAEGHLTRSTPVKPGALHQAHNKPSAFTEVPTSPFVSPPFADTSTLSEPVFANQEAEDENPFAAYEIIDPRPQAWEIETTQAPTRQDQQTTHGGSMDRFVNVAIIVVGVLVLLGALVLVLTRLDLSGLTASASTTLQPTSYTGGDPYRTTGGGILTIGGPGVQDTVVDYDEAHNWSFQGRAGQHVTITAVANGDTDPRIRLIDPDGRVLAEDDDSGEYYGLGQWDSYLVYTLPRDGLYTIRVDIYVGGNFTLNVG